MIKLSIKSRFTLELTIPNQHIALTKRILDENNVKYNFCSCISSKFEMINIPNCTIARAEVIRKLLNPLYV